MVLTSDEGLFIAFTEKMYWKETETNPDDQVEICTKYIPYVFNYTL